MKHVPTLFLLVILLTICFGTSVEAQPASTRPAYADVVMRYAEKAEARARSAPAIPEWGPVLEVAANGVRFLSGDLAAIRAAVAAQPDAKARFEKLAELVRRAMQDKDDATVAILIDDLLQARSQLKLDPADKLKDLHLGSLLAKAGRTDQAIAVAERITDQRYRKQVLETVARKLAKTGKLDEADALLKKEVPEFRMVNFWSEWVIGLVRLGRIEEARNLMVDSASHVSGEAATAVIEALASAGRFDDAAADIEAWTKAIRSAPKGHLREVSVLPTYALAAALQRAGHKQKASELSATLLPPIPDPLPDYENGRWQVWSWYVVRSRQMVNVGLQDYVRDNLPKLNDREFWRFPFTPRELALLADLHLAAGDTDLAKRLCAEAIDMVAAEGDNSLFGPAFLGAAAWRLGMADRFEAVLEKAPDHTAVLGYVGLATGATDKNLTDFMSADLNF